MKMRLLIIVFVSLCDAYFLEHCRIEPHCAFSIAKMSLGARSGGSKLHMGIIKVEDEDSGDDDGDDEEGGELLSFKQQNDFLEAMKELVEKTGSFGEESAAVADNVAQVQADRERKLKMFDELREIDGRSNVDNIAEPQGNKDLDRENMAAQLRKAFAQDEQEEEGIFGREEKEFDMKKDEEIDDKSDVTLGLSESAVELLKGALSARDRAGEEGGGAGGESKAREVLQAAAEEVSMQNKEISAAPSLVSDMVSAARNSLLESLAEGLPEELRNLKKCPLCKKPATQAEIAELGKCSFCRQTELAEMRPSVTTGMASRSNGASTPSASSRGPKPGTPRGAVSSSVTTAGTGLKTVDDLDKAGSRVYKPAQSAVRQRRRAQTDAEEVPEKARSQREQQQHRSSPPGNTAGGWGGRAPAPLGRTQGVYSQPPNAYSGVYRGAHEDSEYDVEYVPRGGGRDRSYYQDQYASHDAVDSFYGVPTHEREAAMVDHILELEREVLHLRAVVKQMEEEQVPQIDDLRNRMDVVMQVLWNSGAVG